MIQVESAYKDEIKIDHKEVLKYLGYPYPYDCAENIELIESCILETESCLKPKACYDTFSVEVYDDGRLDLGFENVSSVALCKNLKGCKEIILFCATVGIELDRLLQRYSDLSPARAAIIQAAGAAAIEAWCDILCKRFQEMNKEKHLKPRFSPGYGDLPLDIQKSIFRALDCSRSIGVSLGEQLLMMPSKSVSAIIGIGEMRCDSEHICVKCEKSECIYRSKDNGLQK